MVNKDKNFDSQYNAVLTLATAAVGELALAPTVSLT